LSIEAKLAEQPHLKRALGRWDLVALFVVAVFNLNVVPSIAANGGVTVWLWLIALVMFFWPQGIAVIELAHRFPGEGGVYLWAKEVFGDFHGFLSGWCYWTNNMMYVPTVLLYFVGVSVFVLGPGHEALADNKAFTVIVSLVLFVLLVALNIRGLGVGKWVNNLGGIGTGVAAATLVILGIVIWSRFGTPITASEFHIPKDPRFVLNSFGVICFGLVGLELASVMGDEIQDPERNLPSAVAWGGVISGALYIAATVTLLMAVSKNDISVLQGIVQAVAHMASRVSVNWIVAPFALMLSLSIAGIASAWLAGSARIPFVHAIVSILLVGLNFLGGSVQETFQKLLSLAVVLQLIPFIYIFAALLKLAFGDSFVRARYSKSILILSGLSGLTTTILAIIVAFFPAQQITSLALYEVWMFGGTALFIGLAAFFFFVYGRRKSTQAAAAGPV
jgi:amino acid transporter